MSHVCYSTFSQWGKAHISLYSCLGGKPIRFVGVLAINLLGFLWTRLMQLGVLFLGWFKKAVPFNLMVQSSVQTEKHQMKW